MQHYECGHPFCDFTAPTIFEIFMHIFTDHKGKDIALDKLESRGELANFKTRLHVIGGSVGVERRN